MSKRFLLKALGYVLSSRLGFWAIKKYAFRTPHAHLFDLDGSLYMGRWRVIDEGTWAGRMLEKYTGYLSIRLHHINRADHDRDLHNHPFNYRTFILHGGYAEFYEDGVHMAKKKEDGYWHLGSRVGIAPFSTYEDAGTRFVAAGDTATGDAEKYHRIATVSEGGVWTLFMMTKNTETWGFAVDHKFVESKRYFLRRGYSKDGVRAANTL